MRNLLGDMVTLSIRTEKQDRKNSRLDKPEPFASFTTDDGYLFFVPKLELYGPRVRE